MSESVAQPAAGDGGDHSQINTSYCFRWSNYQSHLSEVVRQLLEEECMVDVTLYAGGERIQAHRLVLCACSSLFQEILSQVNEEHPTIILSDISPQDVRSIVEFSYNGEVRIPVENINNLLEAAHSLKICGLMEIDGLDEFEMNNDKDTSIEETYILNELTQADEEEIDQFEKANEEDVKENVVNKLRKRKHTATDEDNEMHRGFRQRRQRKSVCKKDYSDEQLANAIAEIKAGKSLLEAAQHNHIPRSTLYMRAKTLKLPLNPTRNEYTIEDMKGAIEMVLSGSSLQQAADCHGIPKTVLWRRIQKEGYQTSRTDARKSYGSEKREAAVRALQRGEALTKVANEYQIPKTTLFRDKVRLVDEGKLPTTVWKKRRVEGEDNKKRFRLEEAVAACKDGKMSQAAASATYQIPKTTIWRRLQKDGKSDSDSNPLLSPKKQQGKTNVKAAEQVKSEELNEADFEDYCPDETEMNITYIDESQEMPDEPVIILTGEDVDELNIANNRSLVVVQEGNDENFISCGLEELDESTTYEKS